MRADADWVMPFPASSARLLLAAVACPVAIGGAQVPELRYSTDLALDAVKHNIPRFAPVAVNTRRNEIVVLGRGGVLAFDSVGTKKKWNVSIGYMRGGSDIITVTKAGWVGDSLWIADDGLKQLVVLDRDGNLLKSIEPFTWIRPQWKDRRRFPLFAGMSWEALYPDGSSLVVPRNRRVIFETPQFDRSKTHLVRVDRDGKILKTIVRIPSAENRLTLHNGMERTVVGIPFFAPPRFDVSTDGQRITVLQPLITATDSGAFMLTSLDANGDTVFSKRFVVDAKRVPEDAVKQALAAIKPFGRYTAEWIRDTVGKQIPAFESRVLGLSSGVDHSVWIWVQHDQPGRRALVIDSTGTVAGMVHVPVVWAVAALGIDRLWMWQREGPINRPVGIRLTRLKRDEVTAARPARTATSAASSRR
jgi:hypothetical protein